MKNKNRLEFDKYGGLLVTEEDEGLDLDQIYFNEKEVKELYILLKNKLGNEVEVESVFKI